MKKIKLLAKKREGTGKGVAHKLRANEQIPAVLYGNNRESQALMLGIKEAGTVIGGHKLIDLDFGEGQVTVILKDMQRHPVTGKVTHMDFQAVDLNQKITITVSIYLTGSPEAIKVGGVVHQIIKEVELECFPTEMPDSLNVDITPLKIGDSLSISDIELPETMKIFRSSEDVIVNIVAPKVAEDTPEEEEEEEAPVE